MRRCEKRRGKGKGGEDWRGEERGREEGRGEGKGGEGNGGEERGYSLI